MVVTERLFPTVFSLIQRVHHTDITSIVLAPGYAVSVNVGNVGNVVKNSARSVADTFVVERLERISGAPGPAIVVKTVAFVGHDQGDNTPGGEQFFALLQKTYEVGDVFNHMAGHDPVVAVLTANKFAERLAAPDKVDFLNIV